MYAVVASEKIDAFHGGNQSVVIQWFDCLDSAQEFVESACDDYHYGVEIVEDNEWRTA